MWTDNVKKQEQNGQVICSLKKTKKPAENKIIFIFFFSSQGGAAPPLHPKTGQRRQRIREGFCGPIPGEGGFFCHHYLWSLVPCLFQFQRAHVWTSGVFWVEDYVELDDYDERWLSLTYAKLRLLMHKRKRLLTCS